jgi:hypothetical protein
VDERSARLREDERAVDDLGRDVYAAPSLVLHVGANEELGLDRDRLAELHEETGGQGREPVPGREQPAGLVEGGGDETAVDKPWPCLVLVRELEIGLVLSQAFALRLREVDSGRVVAAAPAGRVVMGRNRLRAAPQRRPPRSWCALKNSREPAVAIAAEAETSSASVAAATICANR